MAQGPAPPQAVLRLLAGSLIEASIGKATHLTGARPQRPANRKDGSNPTVFLIAKKKQKT